MNDRLERFRAYMESFDVTDPRVAIARDFYVPLPESAGVPQIVARAAIQRGAAQAVIGGIGFGKTTQLLAAEGELNRVPGIVARYVDVRGKHRLDQPRSGVLLALAGLELSAILEVDGAHDVKETCAELRRLAEGKWVDPWERDGDDRPEDTWSPGVLSPPPRPSTEVGALASVVRRLGEALGGRSVVILFDGLDRVPPPAFAELVRLDQATLRSLGIGTVVAGSEQLAFGASRFMLESFDPWHHVAAIDTARDSIGRAFLQQVLRRRASSETLPDESADRVVALSGGIVRDLIALARAAGAEAYMDGARSISIKEVESAADGFGRKRIFGLGAEELSALQRVRRTGQFVETSDADVTLLMTGRLLQYARPHSRFEVHPTLLPLLKILDRAA